MPKDFPFVFWYNKQTKLWVSHTLLVPGNWATM